MRFLRALLSASAVAGFTAASVLVASAPAQANDWDCTASWLCPSSGGRSDLFEGTGLGLDDFKQTWEDMAGWGAPQPEPGCTPEKPFRSEVNGQSICAPIVQGYATGPGGAVRTLGSIGTAQEVKAGTALSARLCATGSACRSVMGWLGRSLDDLTSGPKYLDVVASDADVSTGRTVEYGPPSFYPSDGAVYASLTDVTVAPDGQWMQYTSTALQERPIVCASWAYDYVVKETGQFGHAFGGDGCQALSSVSQTFNFWTSEGRRRDDLEIRRIHFIEKAADGVKGARYDRGFYWGQDYFPEGARNQVTLRCQAADGSESDVVGEAVLTTLNTVVTPSCPPGSKPLWAQLDVVLPDGTKQQQSIQNLRPSWDPETRPRERAEFPDCQDANCSWIIKVGGTWCAKGVAGCLDWAERPEDAQCWFGPYQQPIARCSWLERAYEPQWVPATQPNLDGDPRTHEGPTKISTPTPGATPAPGPTKTPKPGTGGNPTPTGSPSPSPSASPSASPSSSPSPSPSTGTGTETPPACTTKWPLGKSQPETVKVANEVGAKFEPATIGGWREPATDWAGEHSSGLALDFMTYDDQAKGDQIAAYLLENAERLGVRWVIWKQRVWNASRASEGWRLMEDRGSATENHMDHVHLLIADQDGSNIGCDGAPVGEGSGSGCLPDGWTWNPIQWVLEPTKCALKWAFVPDGEKVQGALDSIRTAWATHPPGVFVEAVRPVLSNLGSNWSAGCLMPNFSPVQGQTLALPCEPPGGGVWAGLYLTLQGVLLVSTAIYLWQMVAASVSARATGA